ncbi:amino acid decarboxylase [Paenibacillus crassostreae]|uniref:Amino acid decarboxylase n=2 Tax=Paenibacillus crassostreae TaxID=1763538 RepID=A0A162KN87_9BACL|nr:aminotransferase class I/II-fold pyridoxal phosphate-dependent enzyme [Paenibacillus crassostreae]AOZ94679.1 amino acid decarboxylase [Paenibacillus crassostreae]OAB71203.1 amino acid decarboxylase [Paenibacillus crassostreae]
MGTLKNGLDKSRAPLYEELIEYRRKKNISFHVPGHKNGQAFASDGSAQLLSEVMEIDVTEITGTDDLHHPEGVIQEAQNLAADCFGAEESFFLVGGSTAGNLSLILTVCTSPGDMLLVQRNVHKSVLHGLMLAGAKAIFLHPQIDPISGLPIAPTAATISATLDAYPHAKGVLLTMPNYHGMGVDLRPLAEVCHHYAVPLLVDEAHGAHYGQHPALPSSALSCGADGVVQSTHKMLSALTMGAMLHVQGSRIDRELLRQRLTMVQSSSPSYPVMASLDLARRQLHMGGESTFTAGLAAVSAFKRGLAKLPRYGLLLPPQQPGGLSAGVASADSEEPPDAQLAAPYTTQDPFKVVIYDDTGVLGGYELQRLLEEHGCIPEMSDDVFVVLLFSLGSTIEDTNHLLDALQHISLLEIDTYDKEQSVLPMRDAVEFSTWNISQEAISTPVAFSMKPVSLKDIECIPLAQCAGRVAAEMIIPYPPGIPILYSGENITIQTYERLLVLESARVKCHGTKDPELHHIMVFKNDRKQENL